jgi:subtilisin family serine protease
VGPSADGRIKPDLMAMGSGVYVAKSNSPTHYGTSSGTSFSCPILAGASALILSVEPTLTPMELLDLLRQNASKSNNPDNLMGWGIINTLEVANSLITTAEGDEIPEDFYILRNYPNPFNPSTKVQFSIPQQSDVKLTLHDMLGREVKLLFDENVEAGMQEFVVDAGNLASGVYLVRMIAGTFNKTIKISLLK